MGGSSFRGPRAAGSVGLSTGAQFQNKSIFHSWPSTGPQGNRETLCAQIFFFTDDDIPLADDLSVIQTVGVILTHLHTIGDTFECVCEGHADVRARAGYNLRLSDRRANAVADELRKALPKKCANLVRAERYGERGARAGRQFWADDRRVDIFVRCVSARTNKPSLGFEPEGGNEVATIFTKGLERLEINGGGTVKAWVPDEISSLHDEVKHNASRTQARFSPVVQKLAAMSLGEYVTEVRSRVTAYIRVSYQFLAARGVHQVRARIYDTVTHSPLFPEESIEATMLIDVTGTSYLASPAGNPVQIWRHLSPGQKPPADAKTMTRSGSAGLLGRPDDLFGKLRAGFPNITSRVAKNLP